MKKLLSLAGLVLALNAGAVNIDFRQVNTNHFTTNKAGGGWELGIKTNLFNGGSTTQAVNILDGFTLAPASNATNYWWDFGKTNVSGERLIYGTLATTSNVFFLGVTNCQRWRLLSFNIVARSNIIVYVPNTIPNFLTNGWHGAPVPITGTYSIVLTNGHELRMTIQSNETLSTLWTTFGQ